LLSLISLHLKDWISPLLPTVFEKRNLTLFIKSVSAIFYIENSSVEETRKNIQKIVKLLRTENPEVITLFKSWINKLFGYQDISINESFSELEGTKKMFATALKKHDDELKKKSEQNGIQKGIIQEKIDTARKMHQKGFALQEIMEITGLSARELGREGIK